MLLESRDYRLRLCLVHHSKQGPGSLVIKRCVTTEYNPKPNLAKLPLCKSSTFSPSTKLRESKSIAQPSTVGMGAKNTVRRHDARPWSKPEPMDTLSSIPQQVSTDGVVSTKPWKSRASRRQHVYSAQNPISSPSEEPVCFMMKQRRESTAWNEPSKVVPESSTPKKKYVETTHVSTTQIREAEFTAWDQDPDVRQYRQMLEIISWLTVFVFAAIPSAFTLVYSTTFPDETAIEWYVLLSCCLSDGIS